MFGIQNYPEFIAAILVFQLIPGPGTLAILAATGRHGVKGGMAAVAGTLAGDALWMCGAVLGLAALLRIYPGFFGALQMAGVAYLCWIGLQLLRVPTPSAATQVAPSPWAGFRQALTVCVTNPKAMLFFVAFFPLFLDAQAGAGIGTLAALMLHVTLLSLFYQTLLVLAGHWVAHRLAGQGWLIQLLRRVCGIALVGFGIRLALDNR
jgi:threonine/homoserine/homoserine lactone efflux protein